MAIRRLILLVAVIMAVSVAIIFYFYMGSDGNPPSFRLTRVERGPIISTVSSTGTVTPVTTVQVGSQLSGQIRELYVDFNSKVQEGQVIARIDPENFEARVRQADAELAVARANVAIQRAAVERTRAELENAYAALAAAKAQTEKARVVLVHAKRDLDRKRALHQQAIISKSQIDDAVAAHDQEHAQFSAAEAQEQAQTSIVLSRKAQLKMSQAQVEHALAQVKQREAALHNSKIDLEHTVIRSPLDGVVIQRNVDIGQTVAASLQAPTLFTIAQDLRNMQVDTNVDEADIGRIQVGQRVTFTVDAFPGREFIGQVEQIRKASQTIQNVVTYTVVVSAENQDQHLLPGMTANVKLVIDERQTVLKVSNAALRFRPSNAETDKVAETSSVERGRISSGGIGQQAERLKRLNEMLGLNKHQQAQVRAIFAEQRERIMTLRGQGATPDDIRTEVKRMWKQSSSAISAILTPEQREKFLRMATSRAANPVTRGRVWLLDKNGTPVPVDIITGISDGSFTEIVRGDLKAGQEVIAGTSQPERRSSGSGLRRFGF
jgi:HlyD family secretion protein